MEYGELSKRVAIDKNRLDEALEQQPVLLQEVGDAYALSLSERDACKDDLVRVAASIAAELRAGDEKISESKIQSLLPLDKRHQIALSDYGRAKFLADKWAGLQEVYRQRGHALKSLVDLHISGYYTRSSVQSTRASSDSYNHESNRAVLAEGRKELPVRSKR